MKILILNGPNLNLLGVRQPDVYGAVTLEQTEAALRREAAALDIELFFKQSNHEGELIDALHQGRGRYDGAIINPGGLTHTSVALADAMAAVDYPVVEVHVSNIFGREDFRRATVTGAAAKAVVAGFGWQSYPVALRGLADYIRTAKS